MVDQRLKKLPAWVRSIILELEEQVEQLKESLIVAQQVDHPQSTGIVKASHSMYPTFNLHDHTTVHFSVNGTVVRVHLRDENQTKILVINSDNALHIEPRAVNNIYIR